MLRALLLDLGPLFCFTHPCERRSPAKFVTACTGGNAEHMSFGKIRGPREPTDTQKF